MRTLRAAAVLAVVSLVMAGCGTPASGTDAGAGGGGGSTGGGAGGGVGGGVGGGGGEDAGGDVDEGALGTDGCSPNATCTDTPTSFTCACNSGFSGDGKTCIAEAPCTPDGGSTCHPLASCVPSGTTYVCQCP